MSVDVGDARLLSVHQCLLRWGLTFPLWGSMKLFLEGPEEVVAHVITLTVLLAPLRGRRRLV